MALMAADRLREGISATEKTADSIRRNLILAEKQLHACAEVCDPQHNMKALTRRSVLVDRHESTATNAIWAPNVNNPGALLDFEMTI